MFMIEGLHPPETVSYCKDNRNHQKKRTIMKHEKHDLFQINTRFYIAGKFWRGQTDILGEYNNENNLRSFIDQKFSKTAAIFRFGDGLKQEKYVSDHIWAVLEFDINQGILLSKAVWAWFILNKNNVVIFEQRGNISKFIYICAVVLATNGMFDSSKAAFEYLRKHRYSKRRLNIKTIEKYCSWYDSLLINNHIDGKSLKLKQIIMLKNPQETQCNSFVFFCNGLQQNYELKTQYIETHYQIMEYNNLRLFDDTKIQVYRTESERKISLFEIAFNINFLEDGLIRYDKDDLIYPYSIEIGEKNIANDFFVDFIFVQSMVNQKTRLNYQGSFFENLNILSSHMRSNFNSKELNDLCIEGYNKIICKVLLQSGFEGKEIPKLISYVNLDANFLMFLGKKDETSKLKNLNIFENAEKIDNSSSTNILELKNLEAKPFKEKIYNHYELKNLGKLKIIPEKIEISESKTAPNKKIIGPPKANIMKNKKISPINVELDPGKMIYSRKTLFWQVLSTIDNTFFIDQMDTDFKFDQNMFEEWFCEPISKQCTKEVIVKKTIILNDRKIFLKSLSLKNLEKKSIDIYSLKDNTYLIKLFYELQIEDVESILKILPSEDEIISLNLFENVNRKKFNSKDLFLKDLNEVERIMYKYKNDTYIIHFFEILLFEKKITDDYERIMGHLGNIMEFYKTLLNSKNFVFLVQTILKLGNLINFQYSKSLNKKKANGFKFSSLSDFLSYKGKLDNQNLMSYLCIMLLKNKPTFFGIFNELRSIQTIKIEDLSAFRENINIWIKMYNNSVEMLSKNIFSAQLQETCGRFLTFAHDILRTLSDEYLELLEIIEHVKLKLGEKDSLKESLNILSEFLVVLEKEYRKQNLT